MQVTLEYNIMSVPQLYTCKSLQVQVGSLDIQECPSSVFEHHTPTTIQLQPVDGRENTASSPGPRVILSCPPCGFAQSIAANCSGFCYVNSKPKPKLTQLPLKKSSVHKSTVAFAFPCNETGIPTIGLICLHRAHHNYRYTNTSYHISYPHLPLAMFRLVVHACMHVQSTAA